MDQPIRSTAAQDRALPPSPWRRWRRPLIGLVALTALGGLGALSARQLQSQRLPQFQLSQLSIASVERADVQRDVAAEGRVVAANSPTLFAPQAGTLQWQIQAGDSVTQGQLLARIASPDLQARVQQERAAAAAAQAEARRAQAEGESERGRVQAAVDTARIELQAALTADKRQRAAFEAGATARLQWEQAQDQLERARIQLKQAESAHRLRLQSLQYELEAKQAAANRAASQAAELERQLAALELRAPHAGAVGSLLVDNGAVVARDAKLLTLVDLSQLDVQIQVPEGQARELSLGLPGEVRVAGQPVAAKLISISPEVVNGEVAARLRFVGSQPPELRQNQRLSARVLLERKPQVASLPRGSFIEQGGGRFAYVLRADGRAERRDIRLGAQSLERVEVLSGLKLGERVVVSGLDGVGEARELQIN
ncbi:HlyD family secretion protein [Inhella inkyongensis]|uniref:HlyD family secretion protein n=1 Tax=Inhella inkyongensis TaxID=392593 RepID=A0A840S120_9BURK|nr:efflux RND transporter periplasmic adaptor subunit [Inhella inkyongensis]MBB5203463.1 HlyD family secretion protein [Inhella inkyongensis]